MVREGKYLYGIIGKGEEKEFGSSGERGDRVYTIPYQDISAVISTSPIRAYDSLAKDVVVRHLFTHQQVIERVMKEHTILPLKFGTFANDEEEVRRILERGYAQFRDLLKEMEGRIELDVVALWDKEAIFKEIAQEKEIKEFKERMMASQQEDFEGKIRIGQMVKSALERRTEKVRDEIVGALKEYTLDLSIHDTLDAMMIMNVAFLMNKEKEKEFDRRIRELDERYHQMVNFRCVGPLPPYSFSTLEVKRMRFEEVDEARRRLGLGEEATFSEIKNAYRRLTMEHHPDKHRERENAQKDFSRITKSYQLLTDYCVEGRCSFTVTAVESFIGIKVLRGSQNGN